jgi:hypothetical protein
MASSKLAETKIKFHAVRHQRAAETDEPDFVPRPQRSDGRNDETVFRFRFADDVLQHPRANVESFEHDEHHEHES